jgi:phosphatidylinositol alpha-1,6-mannosyltransferase
MNLWKTKLWSSSPEPTDMKLNILALVTECYGGQGGIAQYNRDLTAALARAANVGSVFILPRLAPKPVAPVPAKVVQARPGFRRTNYALRALYSALVRRPNLLICGHLYMAPLTFLLSQALRIPYLVQMHGTEIWRQPSRLQAIALERAASIFCVSRHTRAQVLKYTRADPSRVVVLPNTFGSDYRPRDRRQIRSALGISNEFVLLTVGRLDTRNGYKGHDRVIRALSRIPEDGRPILYKIAGEGDDRSRLEALTDELGVQNRVQFLGFTSRDTLPDLFLAADLFIMPSTGEGFGIVFLEAMASGTPALGLAVGGATDPLDFGPWGSAVTESELEAAIRRAMAQPRPDPVEMHEAVSARFGFEVFARQAVAQIDRLSGNDEEME